MIYIYSHMFREVSPLGETTLDKEMGLLQLLGNLQLSLECAGNGRHILPGLELL